MPADQRKTISIIVTLCAKIEDRCVDYRRELIELVGDILLHERRNRISRTNIQQIINDKCNATGRYLATERTRSAKRGDRQS